MEVTGFITALIIGLIIGVTVAAMTDQWWWSTVGVLAGATMGAVGYLLTLLRRGQLTPGRLACAALFYLAFAVALVVYLA